MTPLVDITFLLLTFLMFTAKFKSESESEQKYVVQRPMSTINTTKIPEKDLAKVLITIDKVTHDTVQLLFLSNEEDRQAVAQKNPEIAKDFLTETAIPVDTTKLDILTASFVKANPKIKVSIDADKEVSFTKVYSAMSAMSKNYKLRKVGGHKTGYITKGRISCSAILKSVLPVRI